jgi:hypothetical protein
MTVEGTHYCSCIRVGHEIQPLHRDFQWSIVLIIVHAYKTVIKLTVVITDRHHFYRLCTKLIQHSSITPHLLVDKSTGNCWYELQCNRSITDKIYWNCHTTGEKMGVQWNSRTAIYWIHKHPTWKRSII